MSAQLATVDSDNAEQLIRALLTLETGEDHEQWVARWTALLQDSEIEDVEAVSAAIQTEYARQRAVILTGNLTGWRRVREVTVLGIRKAQMDFVRRWLNQQYRLERIAEVAEQQARTSKRGERRALHERRVAIALERVAAIQHDTPKADEPVLLVQAAYHLICTLKGRLREAGIDPLPSGHERELEHALEWWLDDRAREQAANELGIELAS